MNISICLAAYVATHFGYITVPALALAVVLIGTSGPRLYRHHVQGQPLPMAGTHWLAVACGLAAPAMIALKAYLDSARDH